MKTLKSGSCEQFQRFMKFKWEKQITKYYLYNDLSIMKSVNYCA